MLPTTPSVAQKFRKLGDYAKKIRGSFRLVSRFQFPVEILTLERYKSSDSKTIYRFEPFLIDVSEIQIPHKVNGRKGKSIDPSDLDTIVVPAREEGFNEVFLGENRWYKIRIHSSMISKIQHIAVYQSAPESRITHIAKVHSIEQWPGTSKYVVNFDGPAEKIGPIPPKKNGRVKPPQAPRYTNRDILVAAKTMDDAF